MPGQRAKEGGTFVTPRALYRSSLTAVDPDVESEAIPVLDTSRSPYTPLGLGQGDNAQYGQNGQLDLAVIVEGFSSMTLELWLLAEIEQRELSYPDDGSSSSSSSSTPWPSTGEWVFVEDKTITKSSLWIVKDIPPGKYKVRVNAISGTGSCTIRENHAA
jgi:hypothetical protein